MRNRFGRGFGPVVWQITDDDDDDDDMFRATMCTSSGEITVSMRHSVPVSCMDDCLVCRVNSTLHTRQSSTQSDKYQVSHRYSYFSWWWAHSPPKHVEKRNKHTKKIIWNVNLMQQGDFTNEFLARHVSGTYAHHQKHQMLSCSIWFSAPSFWMGVYTRLTQRLSRPPPIVHTTYAAALKTTTHPKTRYRKPYAATQHLMLLLVGVCTRNMSS